MFADNRRISRRQLARQLLLGLAGAFLLTMPQIPDMRGWSGILGLTAGTLLIWIYLFFLVRTAATARSLRERTGRFWYGAAAALYLSYFVMSGGYLVRMTSDMISSSLLPDYSSWTIGALFILAALLGTGGELQRRARLGEVCCVPVVGGLFLLILLAAFQIEPAAVVSWDMPAAAEVLKSTYHVFCAFSIVGVLPFLMHCVERPQSSVKYLFASTGAAAVLTGGAMAVIWLLFGIRGTGWKEFPLTALVAAVNFPGGFLDRFDAVWMIFLIFSLLYSCGTILYYSQHLVGEKKSPWIRAAIAVLAFWAAFGKWQNRSILVVYPWCVRWVYVPVFVMFGLGLSKFRRKT